MWKVPVFGVFLVRIFPYSVQMRENADQKTPNMDTFHAVKISENRTNLRKISENETNCLAVKDSGLLKMYNLLVEARC